MVVLMFLGTPKNFLLTPAYGATYGATYGVLKLPKNFLIFYAGGISDQKKTPLFPAGSNIKI
jgi:hypothetical protein